ncbi:MAG: DnaJ C-terminal domain-containing protein [Betaproteobacteria bacterium]
MKAPHRILGIAADADAAAIKKAFRKLAMALHPDRNPAPDAAERFKSVRAAYDAMMAAMLDVEAEAEFSSNDEDEAADAPTPEVPERGEDIRRDLELTLEEAAFGCCKTLTLAGAIPCATCDGSGEYGASRSNLCGHCHGSGRIQDGRELARCPICDGRGFITERACPDCGGSGRHAADRHLQVHVPAGVIDGSELRLAGQGGEAPPGGVAGHLFLRIVLAPHPVFQPVERDLLCHVQVSIFRWLAGGSVEVPLLGGSHRKVKLSPGRTLHPEPHRLKGLGLANHAGQHSGDLVVAWQLILPATLTAEQIALLNAADRAK